MYIGPVDTEIKTEIARHCTDADSSSLGFTVLNDPLLSTL